MLAAALGSLASCSEPFDDTEIWESIEDLKSRVTALEASVADNVAAIQSMVSVGSIASWEYDAETGKATIKLTDGKTITVDQTVTGYSLVTIEKDEDGNYYWAVCKDGVTAPLEINGKKVPVSVTPSLKISDENEWMISVDGGKTWIATGITYNGESGDDPVFFQNVKQDGDFLVLTLVDGSEIKVAIVGEASFTAASDTLWFSRASMEKSVALEMVNVREYTITEKPEGWKARIEESYLFVTSPEDFEQYPAKGEIKVLALFEDGVSPEIISLDVIWEPMFTLSRNDEHVSVELSEHTAEDFNGYVLKGWKRDGYTAAAAAEWLNSNAANLVPYEGNASYEVSEIIEGYSEDEAYVIFAAPYLPAMQVAQGNMKYQVSDICSVNYKKAVWKLSGLTYDSASITVGIDSDNGYYGGFMSKEDWTNFGKDNVLEMLSYGNGTVYKENSYTGPAGAFPSGSDPVKMFPDTEYVVWYIPVKGAGSYSEDDIVTYSFMTKDIKPSASMTAPAYDVKTVTVNGFTAEVFPVDGAYKTYATAVKAAALPETEDEIVRFLIRNGQAVAATEKNIYTTSSYSDEDEVYFMAVTVAEDGSYGAVAKEQIKMKTLSFVDGIGVEVTGIEYALGAVNLKLAFTGMPASITYMAVSYTYYDDATIQRLLALDQMGEAKTVDVTSSETEVYVDGLINGSEYVFYAVVRDEHENASAKLCKYEFIPSVDIDYILEDAEGYSYGMPQLSGSWTDSETYVLNVSKPDECRRYWLYNGDREYFTGDPWLDTDKLVTRQLMGVTLHEESVSGKVYSPMRSHSRIYMAWEDDKGEYHQIYEYKPAK